MKNIKWKSSTYIAKVLCSPWDSSNQLWKDKWSTVNWFCNLSCPCKMYPTPLKTSLIHISNPLGFWFVIWSERPVNHFKPLFHRTTAFIWFIYLHKTLHSDFWIHSSRISFCLALLSIAQYNKVLGRIQLTAWQLCIDGMRISYGITH